MPSAANTASTTHTTHLLIIDPQNDFCDLPPDWWCTSGGRVLGDGAGEMGDASAAEPIAPSLPVSGSHLGMLRLAGLMQAKSRAFDAITVTLDTHHRLHIAHPGFWQQQQPLLASGEGAPVAAVAPFTEITAAMVRQNIYTPRNPALLDAVLAYLDALELRNRYRLMVWPVHCEIGSWGHNVHAAVRSAYNAWEMCTQKTVQKVMKGSCLMTEHYSALQAEVPSAADASTLLNRPLLASLAAADRIVVAGEASSHCVRATVEDLAEHVSPARLVLLADCMHPVAGFEAQHRMFLETMAQRGAAVTSSAEFA